MGGRRRTNNNSASSAAASRGLSLRKRLLDPLAPSIPRRIRLGGGNKSKSKKAMLGTSPTFSSKSSITSTTSSSMAVDVSSSNANADRSVVATSVAASAAVAPAHAAASASVATSTNYTNCGMNSNKNSRRVLQEDWMVSTPYGIAKVASVRYAQQTKQYYYDLDFFTEEWNDKLLRAASASGGASVSSASYYGSGNSRRAQAPTARMTTCEAYPSTEPQIGSEVVLTCFNNNPSTRGSVEKNGQHGFEGGDQQRQQLQRGRVIELRPKHRQAVVRLVSWRLQQPQRQPTGGKKTAAAATTTNFVKCYMNYDSLQVVAPKPLAQLSACEKLLYVEECRTMANQLYLKQNWKASTEFYEACLGAIRFLLSSSSSRMKSRCDKEDAATAALLVAVRPSLLLTKIKCRIQAARCSWTLQHYEGAINHCMSALQLLKALEETKCGDEGEDDKESAWLAAAANTSSNTPQQHSKLIGEVRVFGRWRVQTLTVLAKVFIGMKQWEPAKEVLQQAHKVIAKYTSDGCADGTPIDQKKNKSRRRRSKRQKQQDIELTMYVDSLAKSDRALIELYAAVEQKRAHEAKKILNKEFVVVKKCKSSGSGSIAREAPGSPATGNTSYSSFSGYVGDNDDGSMSSLSISLKDDYEDECMMNDVDDAEDWPQLQLLLPPELFSPLAEPDHVEEPVKETPSVSYDQQPVSNASNMEGYDRDESGQSFTAHEVNAANEVEHITVSPATDNVNISSTQPSSPITVAEDVSASKEPATSASMPVAGDECSPEVQISRGDFTEATSPPTHGETEAPVDAEAPEIVADEHLAFDEPAVPPALPVLKDNEEPEVIDKSSTMEIEETLTACLEAEVQQPIGDAARNVNEFEEQSLSTELPVVEHQLSSFTEPCDTSSTTDPAEPSTTQRRATSALPILPEVSETTKIFKRPSNADEERPRSDSQAPHTSLQPKVELPIVTPRIVKPKVAKMPNAAKVKSATSPSAGDDWRRNLKAFVPKQKNNEGGPQATGEKSSIPDTRTGLKSGAWTSQVRSHDDMEVGRVQAKSSRVSFSNDVKFSQDDSGEPWYQRPEVMMGVGVVAGGALVMMARRNRS